MTTSWTKYDALRGMRLELVDVIRRLTDVLGSIQEETPLKSATDLAAKVEDDTFSVLVIGQFNAGKSTVVNALLGEKVLPAGMKPTTAVLSVVRWAPEPAITLYRTDEGQVSGLDPVPHPVPAGELAKHIVVGNDETAENEWGLADIEWPLDLCAAGVNIVDSPGLNDDPTRTRITIGYTTRADAVVLVVSALQALNEQERRLVDDELRMFNNASGNLFCLVNRINQIDPEDRAEAVDDLRTRIAKYWGLGPDRVDFVDAKRALNSRLDHDRTGWQAAGLATFEERLEQFLAKDRGRIKIVPPAAEVRRLVGPARLAIEGAERMLDQKLSTLERKYEEQRVPLNGLVADRVLINTTVTNHIAATRAAIEDSARRMLLKAADSCAEWTSEIDREHRVTFNVFKAKTNVRAVVKEISTGLAERIVDHTERWQSGELTDLVKTRSEDLESAVHREFVAFADSLDQVKAALQDAADDAEAGAHLPSRAARIGGALIALPFNPGSLFIGAQFGPKAVLKELLPQFGIAFAVAILGFGPGALLAAVMGTSLVRGLLRMEKVNQKIVATVVTAVSDKLRADAATVAAAIAAGVCDQFDRTRAEIDEGMAEAIEDIHRKVAATSETLKAGEEAVAERRVELAEHRAELDQLDRRAAQLIDQWPMG